MSDVTTDRLAAARYRSPAAAIAEPIMYRPQATKNAPLPCAITSSHVGPVSLYWASR
jgi:hypothetical protein